MTDIEAHAQLPPNPVLLMMTNSGGIGGQDVAVIFDIQHETQPELFLIIEATDLVASLPGPGQSRQEHRGENGDDGDDH